MKTLFALLAVTALSGCTAPEKAFVKELEDLPGVTCEVNAADGLENCHPDTLEDSSLTGPPLNDGN